MLSDPQNGLPAVAEHRVSFSRSPVVKGKARLPVWMDRRTGMVGSDSGKARVKTALSCASPSSVGV